MIHVAIISKGHCFFFCVNIECKLVTRGHVSGCVTCNSQQFYIPIIISGQRSFQYRVVSLWKNLHEDLKLSNKGKKKTERSLHSLFWGFKGNFVKNWDNIEHFSLIIILQKIYSYTRSLNYINVLWWLIEAWFSFWMEDRQPKKKVNTLGKQIRRSASNIFQKWRKEPITSGNNIVIIVTVTILYNSLKSY